MSIKEAIKPCIFESSDLQKKCLDSSLSSNDDKRNLKNQDDHSQVHEPDGRILQIVVDRVRAVTIRALLSVQGFKTKAIVDTGAEVTVLSERLYKSLPQDKRPALQKAKRGLIVAEAGKKMTTCGTFDAQFKLGEFEWPVYVAPIGDDILLGCDIIDEMDITVNTKRGIHVRDQWVECQIVRSHDTVGPVIIARAVTVPAMSEFVMTASCDMKRNHEALLFEADETAKENLLIARSLVNRQTGKVPVKVINQSSSSVKLKKGVVLGKLHPVGSIMPTQENYDISQHRDGVSVCQLKSHEDTHDRRQSKSADAKVSSKTDTNIDGTNFSEVTSHNEDQKLEGLVPEHLKDLFKRSSENLDVEQSIKLAGLFNKYQGSFAKTRTEYGKCSVLKHKIDTAEAAPVRQPLRRTPQAFQGEEEKYIQEQLKAGVIQPSSSAWSSPIVMVRKKAGDVRVCIDYRKLNERNIKDAYPLPRIDMCLDCLASTKIFSTIDL